MLSLQHIQSGFIQIRNVNHHVNSDQFTVAKYVVNMQNLDRLYL